MGGLGRGDARTGPREYRVAVEADLRDRVRVGDIGMGLGLGLGLRLGLGIGIGMELGIRVRVAVEADQVEEGGHGGAAHDQIGHAAHQPHRA